MAAVVQPPADAFVQSFTLLNPDGTPLKISLDDVAFFQSQMVKLAINRGVMIGASAIMLVALAVLTRADRRSSPIFAINAIALLLNGIKQILMAIFLTGPFTHPYAYFAADYDRVTGIDKSNSIAVPVLTTILLGLALASLLMQVSVISATMQKLHRTTLLSLCAAVASCAVGFQFALMVVNCQNIVDLRSGFTPSFQRLQKQTIGTSIAAILLFTTIFVLKLGFAIFNRKQLGVVHFGPMQVIFIMGVQTLLVPSIIACLQFAPDLPEMNSWFLTLVVLSLPLSSLWASTASTGMSQASSRATNPLGTNEKTLCSQKSHSSLAYRAPIISNSDIETGHGGIIAEKSWSIQRSAA